MRGYVIERRNGESDLHYQIREEMVAKLAAEWSAANRRRELQVWEEQDEREIYGSSQRDECQEDQEEDAWHFKYNECRESGESEEESRKQADFARQEVRDEWQARNWIDLDRMEVIQGMLRDLGARMARPYEHWNEDEQYMEYMENRGY